VLLVVDIVIVFYFYFFVDNFIFLSPLAAAAPLAAVGAVTGLAIHHMHTTIDVHCIISILNYD
jgi:hypothetical protein